MTAPATTATDVTTLRLGTVEVDIASDSDHPVSLLAVRPAGTGVPAERGDGTALVEVGLLGDGHMTPQSSRHDLLATMGRLRPLSIDPTGPSSARVVQVDPATGLEVTVELDADPEAPALRWRTTAANTGAETVTLGYLSSAAVAGVGEVAGRHPCLDPGAILHVPRNAWTAEARWHATPLAVSGLVHVGSWPRGGTSSRAPRHGSRGSSRVEAFGTWSTADFLPMGAISLDGSPSSGGPRTWLWQIEHNGPWSYTLADEAADVVVRANGPADAEHDFRHRLAAGETFTAVPATVVVVDGELTDALRALTVSRRRHRRQHPDNRTLPVIFNDYMNCLMGDPTTEKLRPVIDAAAAAGAEYFVIDAGWYADGPGWWDSVGAWEPSTTRFPDGGLAAVIDRIHDRGMVPGLWLEPEVIGVASPVADELPDEAFFGVDGQRLIEAGRHQLDFRHPEARAHLDAVVDRLVGDFGIGYFKLDYNINPGHGTTVDAASRGDGLLGHNRAFLRWIDDVLDRHPGLVLENCSSGGCRMEYGQLSHFTLQSTSDQLDPLRYASIAAGVASAVLPEQSATWAYPLPDNDDETNALCLVNAMLGRIHLSGRLDLMDERQRAVVQPALDRYKEYREKLAAALPFWPLGLPGWDDTWVALGMTYLPEDGPGESWIAVWRRGGADSVRLPGVAPGGSRVEVLYPEPSDELPTTVTVDGDDLVVELPHTPSARMLHVRHEG